MSKHDRYNHSPKGRARNSRYFGSTKGIRSRLEDRRRKALRRLEKGTG